MPLATNGVYLYQGDRAYEVEVTYYLKFQILSALASIARINDYDPRFTWDNRCQYYHYYCDHLLYSIGQISNRFISKDKEKQNLKERKRLNCCNYRFTETEFPILSDKRARNTIEHIDEHNRMIIESRNGVGGFNLIENETKSDLVKELKSKRSIYPYILDLLNSEILIYRKNAEEINLSLVELKAELLRLQKSIEAFESMIVF